MKNKKEKIVKIPYSQDSTINWLLKGDISIRWQVMRDLLDRPKQEWQIVQSRLPDEGWCRQILKYRVIGEVDTASLRKKMDLHHLLAGPAPQNGAPSPLSGCC